MTETDTRRPMGMRAFTVIWIGQIISLLGSAMTGFAVTIWVYEGTEKATALALAFGFFFVTPLLLLSPVAGAIVDRSNRRLMMMLSDLAAGATTVVVLVLYATGNLEVWHLFITNAISGAFNAFQWPAFSAAISVMLPKEQYGRANGMMELAMSGSNIFAPVLAGALLGPLGLSGILLIDIFTFVFAVGALLFVHIPQPETTEAGREGQGSLLTESFYGLRYIIERPSLLGLQLVFLIGNFLTGVPYTVYAAMILARTGNDEFVFGSVQSASAIGGVVGGLAMAAWGGPKRRVHGVLGGWILSGFFVLLVGVGQTVPVWVVAAFVGTFLVPIINGSNQAIWQAKVAPDVQGRVFSMRRLIAWFVNPISALLAGPLADLLLEPAMVEGGGLAGTWGRLVGTGPGAGMALMFVFGGGLAIFAGVGGYAVRAVRAAEDILPDHDSPEARVEPKVEERPPQGWTMKRKLGAIAASAILAVLILGLGWLQIEVLTASDEEPVVVGVGEVDLKATPAPSSTVAPTPPPTQEPTQVISQATGTAAPTVPPPTPTSVPPTATPLPALAAGELVTYTLTVSNNGPSDATGVVVSDTLPAGVIFDWALASQGAGCTILPNTQDAASGGIVLCDLGTLGNGASAAITIAVTIDPLMGGVITNSATIVADEPDPNPADNAVKRENLVYAEANLAIHAQLPDMVIAGTMFSYTLTAFNNGPLDASGVTIINDLPAGLVYISGFLDRGSGCSTGQASAALAEGVTIVCDLGDLGSGDSATATIFAAADASAEGAINSGATVGAKEIDLHMLDNVTNTVTMVQVQADLAIGIVAADADEQVAGADLALQFSADEAVVAGRTLTYTVHITNNGPWQATGVVINDVLPVGLTFLSVTSPQGSGCANGQRGILSCVLGELDSGDTVTVAIEVLVDSKVSGTITNTVTVLAQEFDVDLSNNTAVEAVTVKVEADLTIR